MTQAVSLAQLGNGPAFSAYRSTSQSFTVNTWTRLNCDIKEFDTNSNYDNTTNYRFQPTVPGYYQMSTAVGFNGLSGAGFVGFYKNGSVAKVANFYMNNGQGTSCSALIYLNGSTDYVEAYFYCSAATSVAGGSQASWFQGFLARGA
jgi:antitoxin component YwqK of YwqJK toxin-antitoxin module